ncbi:hypothetical protein ACIBEA_38905 [Streptomyces sp. NPDC051555]|uniref:hypothetical protein n=1 Tax=Streptomyces sp. NPDC051555 TaxID=3365657 RepID=UPI0037B10AB6
MVILPGKGERSTAPGAVERRYGYSVPLDEGSSARRVRVVPVLRRGIVNVKTTSAVTATPAAATPFPALSASYSQTLLSAITALGRPNRMIQRLQAWRLVLCVPPTCMSSS